MEWTSHHTSLLPACHVCTGTAAYSLQWPAVPARNTAALMLHLFKITASLQLRFSCTKKCAVFSDVWGVQTGSEEVTYHLSAQSTALWNAIYCRLMFRGAGTVATSVSPYYCIVWKYYKSVLCLLYLEWERLAIDGKIFLTWHCHWLVVCAIAVMLSDTENWGITV